MDWLRTSLIASIAFVCFLLVIRWGEFQERQHDPALAPTPSESEQQTPTTPDAQVPTTDHAESLPAPDASDTARPELPPVAAPASTNLISVTTDVLDLKIDPHGGDIVYVALLNHLARLDTPDQPFVLLNQTDTHTYVARSGLVGQNGTDTNEARPVFSTEQTSYQMDGRQDSLSVDLHYQQSPEVTIIKRFVFGRGSHLIDVEYEVQNQSAEPWVATIYGQIERDSYNPTRSTMFAMSPFLGAATSTEDTNYRKLKFSDFEDRPFEHRKEGSWVAMVQHYFISAWVPDQSDQNRFRLFQSRTRDLNYLQFTGGPLTVAPQSTGVKSAQFYAGPKDIRLLAQVSPYLDLTVDYSFLWWIAKPLFYALDTIHSFVGNWGVAIILLTFLIKLLFFYPSAASYRSMAKMRKLQPKMADLKERFGEDRQKFSAEVMKLYRQEKVNPLGGCLPILIQMPVFIALYWVLMESVELRHAPFILWIQDLSVKDPYYVLPLIMGASMWFQQKLNPTPPDPMQAKIMQMMPIFFTFLFLFFPAGLVLYWVVNQTLSIAQQYYITKQIEKT